MDLVINVKNLHIHLDERMENRTFYGFDTYEESSTDEECFADFGEENGKDEATAQDCATCPERDTCPGSDAPAEGDAEEQAVMKFMDGLAELVGRFAEEVEGHGKKE